MTNKIIFFTLSICQLLIVKSFAAPPATFDEQQRIDYEHDFIEANKLKLMGNLPNAANLFTRCTEVNPNDAVAFFALSEIYIATNNEAEALRNARRAAQLDPKNIWYKLRLAELYSAAQLADSAVLVYRDIVKLKPDDTDMRMDLAMLYLEAGQFKKALNEIKFIEKTYGFTMEVAIVQYLTYSKKGDIKATEKLLRKSIKELPDELRFYGLLAELYSSTGKEKEAQENYRKLLEADPENALGYLSMIEFYKEYGNNSQVLTEMQRMYDIKTIHPDLKVELYLSLTNDTAFARKYVHKLDDMIEQLGKKYPDNFRVRMVNADRNLRQQRLKEAREDLLFITDRVPTNAFLWEQLLIILNYLQDNETLYESSAKALEFFDKHYLFNFLHGFSAYILKKPDEAIVSFVQTLECLKKEKTPDRKIEIQSMIFLGEAYNDLKQYDLSDEIFEKAIEMMPDNPLILNNYSYYLSVREEKLDVAEKHIKKCIALEPDNSTYLDTYGWVLYKLGHIDAAIDVIELAIKNGGSDNPEIIDHLCELLVAAGRINEATQTCQQAIEMNEEAISVEQKIENFQKKSQL
ncbi:MAG: tetratricopeptide repeat protein [Bacteroidales bacterium]|nr:tetratricopeptide repeat protein [Bacteroidales bacterium]